MIEQDRIPPEGFTLSRDPLKDRRPSIYLLILRLPSKCVTGVGSLGEIEFRSGTYVYVGSAKGGLNTRSKRHLGSPEKRRWHIDYLTPNSSHRSIWRRDFYLGGECETARRMEARYQSVEGFGSSDCKCRSHLFYTGAQ